MITFTPEPAFLKRTSEAQQAFEAMMPIPEWVKTTHPEKESGTSQTLHILAYMKAGQSITGLDALIRFGCFRLPARIADIKKLGHTVNREMIEVNGKRVARYWMEG
jgi:hypothetical protein